MSDSVLMIMGNSLTSIVSMLINIVLVGKLSIDNFGVYSILFSIFMISTGILSLAARPILARYLPEVLAQSNRRGVLRLTTYGTLTHLFAGLLIVLVCAAVPDRVANWQNIDPDIFRGLLPFFALFVILKFEAAICEQILMSHRSHLLRNAGIVGFQLLKLGLYWFFLPHDGSIRQVVIYQALSNLLLLLLFGARVLKLTFGAPGGQDAPLDLKRLTRYGSLAYSAQVSGMILEGYVGTLFVGNLFTNAQAALYGFATRLVWTLGNLIPAQSLVNVIVPAYVAEYTRNRDLSQLTRVFSFYNKVVTSLFAPVTVGGMMLIGPIIMVVFRKPEYLDSVSVFNISLAGLMIFYYLNSCSFLLAILEKPEITLYSRVFAVLGLLAYRILTPLWGIDGAALAASSSLVLSYVFVYLMLKRVMPIRLPWLATFRIAIYCGAMALAIWPLMGWATSLWRLLAVILLGAAVYGLLSWLMPVFSREERRSLNKAFGRRLFRI